jgi:hypothetical protein
VQAAAAGGCNGGGKSKVSSEKSEGGELGCGWEEDGGDFGDDAGDAEIDSPSTAAAAAGCADDDGAAADADEVNAAGTAGSIASRGVGCDELLLLLLLLMLLLFSRSPATASAAAAGATAE